MIRKRKAFEFEAAAAGGLAAAAAAAAAGGRGGGGIGGNSDSEGEGEGPQHADDGGARRLVGGGVGGAMAVVGVGTGSRPTGGDGGGGGGSSAPAALHEAFAKRLRVAVTPGELRWSKDVAEVELQRWVSVVARTATSVDVEVWHPHAPGRPRTSMGASGGGASGSVGGGGGGSVWEAFGSEGTSRLAAAAAAMGVAGRPLLAAPPAVDAVFPAVGVLLRVAITKHYPHVPPTFVVQQYPLMSDGRRLRSKPARRPGVAPPAVGSPFAVPGMRSHPSWHSLASLPAAMPPSATAGGSSASSHHASMEADTSAATPSATADGSGAGSPSMAVAGMAAMGGGGGGSSGGGGGHHFVPGTALTLPELALAPPPLLGTRGATHATDLVAAPPPGWTPASSLLDGLHAVQAALASQAGGFMDDLASPRGAPSPLPAFHSPLRSISADSGSECGGSVAYGGGVSAAGWGVPLSRSASPFCPPTLVTSSLMPVAPTASLFGPRHLSSTVPSPSAATTPLGGGGGGGGGVSATTWMGVPAFSHTPGVATAARPAMMRWPAMPATTHSPFAPGGRASLLTPIPPPPPPPPR